MKIEWDLTKDKFDKWVKSVLICEECGWLLQNPRKMDAVCPNCGKTYAETGSKEEFLSDYR